MNLGCSLARCLAILLAEMLAGVVHAGPLMDAVGFGGDSGKLAKLSFRLRDSFYVTSVAWSPDGQYIATSSTQSPLLHVWDVRHQSITKEFKHGVTDVNTHVLVWSPDGRYLAACNGGILHVYRVADWSGAHRFVVSESSGCTTAAFSNDSSEIAILGRRLRVFSTSDWSFLRESDLRNGWARGHLINAIGYLPGTHDILIGGGQFEKVNDAGRTHDSVAGYLWLLRAAETIPGRQFAVYPTGPAGGADVISIAIAPDGQRVATGIATGTGSADSGVVTKSVHILNLPSGALLGAPLDGMGFGPQHGLAFSPNGRYVIAGHAEDHTRAIHVIDVQSERVVDVVHAGAAVLDIAVEPQGARFAAAAGQQVLVWILPNQR
jgi:WD40 repeat protein